MQWPFLGEKKLILYIDLNCFVHVFVLDVILNNVAVRNITGGRVFTSLNGKCLV